MYASNLSRLAGKRVLTLRRGRMITRPVDVNWQEADGSRKHKRVRFETIDEILDLRTGKIHTLVVSRDDSMEGLNEQ